MNGAELAQAEVLSKEFAEIVELLASTIIDNTVVCQHCDRVARKRASVADWTEEDFIRNEYSILSDKYWTEYAAVQARLIITVSMGFYDGEFKEYPGTHAKAIQEVIDIFEGEAAVDNHINKQFVRRQRLTQVGNADAKERKEIVDNLYRYRFLVSVAVAIIGKG